MLILKKKFSAEFKYSCEGLLSLRLVAKFAVVVAEFAAVGQPGVLEECQGLGDTRQSPTA
jgi:hypothetical protein